MKQFYRFCCSCGHERLIINQKCYFCKGDFLVLGEKDSIVLGNKNEKIH
mgnify:CR=1 FL=1